MDYKGTINLPKTDFSMKAGLTQREPQFLKRWEDAKLYEGILQQKAEKPKFVLHDGPPYANGNIHLGHVMNKTLKDFVVKSRTMTGMCAPYIPGWDCHGLPIEHQVLKKLGSKAKTLSPTDLRKECRAYAERFIGIQREEFRRLGIFGDWDRPYKTMDFSYQATIAREFGKVVEKGYVYRSRKAVHWCISCETALAEAEIEYEEHTSPSIYVSYPVISGWEEAGLPKTDPANRFLVIWTTTPWTLPASMAVAFHEKESYVVIGKKGEPARYIVAAPLVESIRSASSDPIEVVATIGPGAKLANLKARHPWIDRTLPLLPGGHVTMDTGTGLVHTAPGHGEEDYELGLKFGIDIYSPVLANGRFELTVEGFAGEKVFEANPKIIAHLQKLGRLFAPMREISHSYPHCWRCKNPVIFRATEQWFLSLKHEDLRQKTLEEIDCVSWVPAWGRERIHGMISARPDWCLSRQRLWGVPVIAFVCKGCQHNLLSSSVISAVADRFEEEGADAWFAHSSEELVPKGTKCPKCSGTTFDKGNDILDVWFDSGASHAAVCEKRKELGWPVDTYLEGSDQHRGWFHSSLLEGVATRGRSPFRSVITHGFVVDGEGKKMSKSLGNYISAQDMVNQNGAEMLRLWVATEDYRNDVRLSKEIMDRVVESYRRIRNTARYCLGNLFDFNPDEHRVAADQWPRSVDRFAADRLSRLVTRVRGAYDRYEFHVVVQAINEFCVVDLSSLYLDISKDTLYCDVAAGVARRSAQTILFDTASALARLLAPILPFTSEDIWDHLPKFEGKPTSVHLAEFPDPLPGSDEISSPWEMMLAVRKDVSKALESLRRDKKIGQSLEAEAEAIVPEPYLAVLQSFASELPTIWIVSRAKIVKDLKKGLEVFESTEIPGLSVGVAPIQGERCERCWTYPLDLGKNSKHSKLCGRCADAVEKGTWT